MQFYYWINCWKKRDSFKFEISVVLLIKAMFLMLLWHLCFSHPLGDQLNDQQMAAHIVPYSSVKSPSSELNTLATASS